MLPKSFFCADQNALALKATTITVAYRKFPKFSWEPENFQRTLKEALRWSRWCAIQKLSELSDHLRPTQHDELTIACFIAPLSKAEGGYRLYEKLILKAISVRFWSSLIEPHHDGLTHSNFLLRINRNQLSRLEKIIEELNDEAGFKVCKLSRPSDSANWSRPGKLPGLVGYCGKNAINLDRILSFKVWLGSRRWIRSSAKTKRPLPPYGFIPSVQHSKNPTESSTLFQQPLPTLEKNPSAPPPSPTGLPVEIHPIHPEEISLKLRIKALQILIKSESNEETLLTLKQNLKEIIAQKKELYPARPREIEYGKAFGKKKNMEKLRENEQAINDARNLAGAFDRGDLHFIAASGLNPDEARPLFSEPEKRDADINNLFETINKWDGKNLKRTNINSKQKRISEYEHWEKVASALIVCREIKKTVERELKAITNDYNKRELIMKGLNQELVMSRKLKDKELVNHVRLNIKSLKSLVIKANQLQFILENMPENIQYHCHLTKQIYHLTRYLTQGNWKKLSTAFKLYDFRQDDSRAENAQKRLDGKDSRKVMKHKNTNLRARDINQEIIEIEDEALKLKNMKKKGG